MTKSKFKGIISGVEFRRQEVAIRLRKRRFKGEYVLISTKPESVDAKKLASLSSKQELVVDLYTPILLEKELTLSRWKPRDWLTRLRHKSMLKRFLQRGNHFLVANRRQREYWIEEAKRLGVRLRFSDISILPTGSGFYPSSLIPHPLARRNVVLWFGGIYPWLSPEPLITAFSLLAPREPEWKLRILGGWQPGTGYQLRYQQIVKQATSTIPRRQLQVISWQSPRQLGHYFHDVAFAVHLAKNTPEDYVAHRVRLLTLLNAGIPLLTSGSDVVSDISIANNAGKRISTDPRLLVKQLSAVISQPKALSQWKKNTTTIESKFIYQEGGTVHDSSL